MIRTGFTEEGTFEQRHEGCREEPCGVLRKCAAHSEEPRNSQIPVRALEWMVFLLVVSSPDLLLLLISSPHVLFSQPRCRLGPAFLLVPLPNIFNSTHMVTAKLCNFLLYSPP